MTYRAQAYPRELRERAVRMVFEVTSNYDTQWAAINAVVEKLGVGTAETGRKWIRQAEADDGRRQGTTAEESAEIKRLKHEAAELPSTTRPARTSTLNPIASDTPGRFNLRCSLISSHWRGR